MPEQAYTLAMYRVKDEEAFIGAWNELARALSSLTQPPLWGACK
jgi:hypothetical protein